MFNDFIASHSLREIERSGARFTWSNHQLNHVRCVLDCVLVSPAWDSNFPLSTLKAEIQLGSDHTPLVLDTGEDPPIRSNRFFFQTGWLALPAFKDFLVSKWIDRLQQVAGCRDPVDLWQFQVSGLRQYLRG